MTTWWWIRHGPTHEKCFVGWRDVPADLSNTAQISRLNTHLPDNALLVSSDLIRASATADAIQQSRNRLPNEHQLREFNFGDWDGMKFDEISQKHPELSRAYWDDPGDITPPNGESWNDTAARVKQFVDRINSSQPNRHIIAVAHIGVIMTQVQRACNISAKKAISHNIDNLSVTRLGWDGKNWNCGKINHLP